MNHKYRDYVPITAEQIRFLINLFGKDKFYKEKFGNRYGSKLKVYLLNENNSKGDMIFYIYGEVIDSKSPNRKLKSIERYLNPKYKDLLTVVAFNESVFYNQSLKEN